MADAAKERLHELVDALPESEVESAKKLLECLVGGACDPVLQAFLDAPEDDEPVTEGELKAIEKAERDIAQGRVKSWEQVKRELGL